MIALTIMIFHCRLGTVKYQDSITIKITLVFNYTHEVEECQECQECLLSSTPCLAFQG